MPENESPADITAEMVEKLIDQKINGADSLGKDPATDKAIYVLNGRYGPYLKAGADSRTLTSEDQLFSINLDEALEI